ncbi:hypothetical protein HDV05_006136, partial [Chytridiales sp. JEL 0842]
MSTITTTTTGPFPGRAFKSEPGYMPNDVGVGCSNGQSGGDPRWKAILENGTYPVPSNLAVNARTVWPVTPTVAVSQRMYGATNKDNVCFQKIRVRNKFNTSLEVEAAIVDFCPTKGCLWNVNDLAYNVDIYGEMTWMML